jgi:phosphate butyryltransferase
MELTSFDPIIQKAKALTKKGIAAVAGAADAHVIEATLEARAMGVVEPLFIGEAEKIREILRSMDLNPSDFKIEEPTAGLTAPEMAVELIKEGCADFIMKGMVETSDLLRPIVKKENNLRTGRTMSHVVFNRFDAYHKLLGSTDGGMTPHPDLNMKKDILINAVTTMNKLGYDNPKVACLACKETYDAKMPETTDARALQEMCERGELGSCTVVGPISYDIAFSTEIAKIKKFDCPHVGNFDLLLTPDIHSGNILGKAMVVHMKAQMTGIVVGAKVPIVLTSRGSSAEEKYLALALCSVVSAEK